MHSTPAGKTTHGSTPDACDLHAPCDYGTSLGKTSGGIPATQRAHKKIMSKLTSLNVLLAQEIKDLYSAENQLVKALP
jgi:hypothetical protein